jgi:hypothetical protein
MFTTTTPIITPATTANTTLAEALDLCGEVPSRPENGVDRCPCGCKYWQVSRCYDCGEHFAPEACSACGIVDCDPGSCHQDRDGLGRR